MKEIIKIILFCFTVLASFIANAQTKLYHKSESIIIQTGTDVQVVVDFITVANSSSDFIGNAGNIYITDSIVNNGTNNFFGADPSNADYNTIGNRGGSKTMSHTHDVDPSNRTTTAGGAHSHNGITDGPVGSKDVGKKAITGTDVPNTSHTHIINDEPDHTHDLDIPIFPSDTASNNENRPPYYTLAFIIKL